MRKMFSGMCVWFVDTVRVFFVKNRGFYPHAACRQNLAVYIFRVFPVSIPDFLPALFHGEKRAFQSVLRAVMPGFNIAYKNNNEVYTYLYNWRMSE